MDLFDPHSRAHGQQQHEQQQQRRDFSLGNLFDPLKCQR